MCKCSLRNELIFQEPDPPSLTEEETEDEADASECEVSEVELRDDEGWDALILKDDDYMSETDVQSVNDD